jgi:hypothetical protein
VTSILSSAPMERRLLQPVGTRANGREMLRDGLTVAE